MRIKKLTIPVMKLPKILIRRTRNFGASAVSCKKGGGHDRKRWILIDFQFDVPICFFCFPAKFS
jgi:hypothetical protein